MFIQVRCQNYCIFLQVGDVFMTEIQDMASHFPYMTAPGNHGKLCKLLPYEPRSQKTGLRGFPTRCDTNQSVQSRKQARSLKFWIKVEEELYYPRIENKDADELRSDYEADLRL